MAGTKIKTQVGALKYVFITGEGRNGAMPGEEPRMQFTASLVCKKDSDIHKDMLAQIDTEWQAYKKAHGVKGLPKTNGIKDEFMRDPSGEIDPETEEVKKVPTGNVLITFKTNTKWPDGSLQEVKVKSRDGSDITKAVHAASWAIGEGSIGRIFGTAMGNNIGGTQKVTLYLTGIQLAKLVKYIGNDIEVDEIEGEDIDLGDEVEAIVESADTQPDL